MALPEPQLPSSPRVLIVRLSAIGDTILVLPVLCALRDRFPEALLGWLVEERAGVLLRGHEALDELITVPRGWLKSPKTVWQLRRRLRRLRFDATIDPQSLTKSAIAAWLSGTRRRIGFGDDWGRELSRWLNTELVQATADHVVDRNLELLRPLGIESPAVRFDVPEHEPDRLSAEAAIRQAGLEAGFGILNPGAGWPSRLWPPERLANVAAHLGNTHGLPSMVVWAGQRERAWAEQIVAGSQGHAHLAAPTTLRELAALERRARLFVGSDTGPMHLAAAVGTPCVSLHGPTSAKRSCAYGPQHVALQQEIHLGPGRKRRTASRASMEAISVQQVCEACDRILKPDGREAA